MIKLQKYKITKIKDFPESVAMGMAWGVAVSFTPLSGISFNNLLFGYLVNERKLDSCNCRNNNWKPMDFLYFLP